jgi:hypothetical protein
MKKIIFAVILAVAVAAAGVTVAFAGPVPGRGTNYGNRATLAWEEQEQTLDALKQFREERLSRMEEILNEKVADGTISRQEADRLQENIEEMMDYCPALRADEASDDEPDGLGITGYPGRGYCMGFYD